MRRKLAELGFKVTERSYAFVADQEKTSSSYTLGHGPEVRQLERQWPGQSPDAARVRGGGEPRSALTEEVHSSSSRKRKLDVYNAGASHEDVWPVPMPRKSSRELMPPPLSRSNLPQRGIRPTDNTHMRRSPVSRQPIKIYEDQSRQGASVGATPAEMRQELQELHLPSREERTLPLRPAASLSSLSQRAPNERLGSTAWTRQAVVAGATPGSSQRINQSSAQLTSDFTQHQRDNQYAPLRDDVAARHHMYLDRGRQIPLDMHHAADFGTAPRQTEDQPRQPLQPFTASWVNQQRPMWSRERVRNMTPSPQRSGQAPAVSVLSPFFRREPAESPPRSAQRPPARGNNIQRQSDNPTARVGHHAWAQRNHIDDAQRQRPLPTSLTSYGSSQPLVMENHFDRSPSARLSTATHVIPQAARNSQGLYERPDRRRSPVMYPPSRPQSTAQRDRYSLPPGQTSRLSTANRQERTLSQIPGVRGLSSQGFQRTGCPGTALYDGPRGVFSSAGSRRSARR